MKHFKHKLLFALLAVFSFTCNMQAQVTIGDGVPPRAGTVLDLKKTNPAGTMGGLLLPTVNITDVGLIPGDFSDVTVRNQAVNNDLAGTMVYNTNATTGEGVYYWDGNKWRKINVAKRDPALIGVGTGVLTGKSCFDIAKGNDNANGCGSLENRAFQRTDFSLTNEQDPAVANVATPYSGTQIYTFTPSGNVSKVRFDYVDASGKVVKSITPNADYSGNNISTPCKVTVVYKHTLNDDLLNKKRAQALKLDLYAIYNINADGTGGVASERAVKLTATLADCACCGAYTTGGKWLAFLCHNLGADESLDPFTPNVGLYGDLYQWGRKDATHAKRNSASNNANGAVPAEQLDANGQIPIGHAKYGKFILNSTLPYDWRTPALNTLWGDGSKEINQLKAPNDPCPDGWKVPSQKQWASIYTDMTIPNTWTWTTAGGSGYKVGHNLFLPAAGDRSYSNGSINLEDYAGEYWSTSDSGGTASANFINIKENTVNPAAGRYRGSGLSVRCVSEK